MKKCLSLLLAALMLAAVLTGCGGNPSTEETDTPADTGTEQAAQTNWNVSSVTGTGTELKFRTGGDQGTYCLLYTSDAADELDGVDLGGRRIIKKKFFSSRRRHTR